MEVTDYVCIVCIHIFVQNMLYTCTCPSRFLVFSNNVLQMFSGKVHLSHTRQQHLRYTLLYVGIHCRYITSVITRNNRMLYVCCMLSMLVPFLGNGLTTNTTHMHAITTVSSLYNIFIALYVVVMIVPECMLHARYVRL